MFKIATEIYENVSRACRKSVRTFQYGFRHAALKSYAKAQQRKLKKVTPRSDRTTKHAADDWEIEYERTGMAVTGFEITNPHDRIDYLEYGTDPHMIFPKRAKVLRFEMDGKIVFARSVEHPGIKPMGFVRKVQDELEQETPAFIRKYFDAPIEKHWN
jgi:hypothetical protein